LGLMLASYRNCGWHDSCGNPRRRLALFHHDIWAFRGMTTDGTRQNGDRHLLFIDMCYSLETVRNRNLHQFFHSRHSGGYFKKVWGLHPMVDRVTPDRPRAVKFTEFSPDQVVIEAAAELYRWPGHLLPVNVLVSQGKLLYTIARLVKSQDISAIAAIDPFYTGLFGLVLKRLCRRPLIVHVIANYDDLYEADGSLAMPQLLRFRWVEKKLAKLVYSRADLVAAGTPTLVNYAVRNGARPERVHFFPLSKAIHPIHFTPPEQRPSPDAVLARMNVPAADHYLLTVSRMVAIKKVVDALKAMRIVMDAEPSVIGLFAGEGPQREELERLATAYGIRDRIVFLGGVDQETLSHIIPRCISVAPMPGMTLFESALGGSPTIAYDRDALIAALVKDGDSGFLAEFEDYQTLGRRALEVVRDRALRDALGRRIRENALPYIDFDALYRREADAFDHMFATVSP